jgi:hypothetical protein
MSNESSSDFKMVSPDFFRVALCYLKAWFSLSFFPVSPIKQGLYENFCNPLCETKFFKMRFWFFSSGFRKCQGSSATENAFVSGSS